MWFFKIIIRRDFSVFVVILNMLKIFDELVDNNVEHAESFGDIAKKNVRISYANSLENIEKAIKRIAEI